MIRLATKNDSEALLLTFTQTPAIGALCEMHWRLLCQNMHMPHKFFVLSSGAVLKLSGHSAALCGTPACEEEAGELDLFLKFNHVKLLTSLGWKPSNWHISKTACVLVRKATGKYTKFTPAQGFDEEPPVNDVMAILKADGNELSEEFASESFWVDFHIRRNHGVCAVYGIWQAGRLVSTAGIWALTPNAGYIANIETLKEYRKRGYASALIKTLCVKFSHLTLSLMCEETMTSFYIKHGFDNISTKGYICRNNTL